MWLRLNVGLNTRILAPETERETWLLQASRKADRRNLHQNNNIWSGIPVRNAKESFPYFLYQLLFID
jgi:hypothetical protein